jgi:metal-responsive CopG/Arc/MetJ family transcriptional regulator
MERLLIQLPEPLKAKLDALRAKGYTASGFIRSLLEKELNAAPQARQPRQKGD